MLAIAKPVGERHGIVAAEFRRPRGQQPGFGNIARRVGGRGLSLAIAVEAVAIAAEDELVLMA